MMRQGHLLAPGDTPARLAGTLAWLRRCQAYRDAHPERVRPCTIDPAWLVTMAINRRAGWLDDDSGAYGSARPTDDGRYPPRARMGSTGEGGDTAWLAGTLRDGPRVTVRPGDVPRRLRARLAARITWPDDE